MILQAIIIISLGLSGPPCNTDETLNLLTAFENACPGGAYELDDDYLQVRALGRYGSILPNSDQWGITGRAVSVSEMRTSVAEERVRTPHHQGGIRSDDHPWSGGRGVD